jgi:hypothetical protein
MASMAFVFSISSYKERYLAICYSWSSLLKHLDSLQHFLLYLGLTFGLINSGALFFLRRFTLESMLSLREMLLTRGLLGYGLGFTGANGVIDELGRMVEGAIFWGWLTRDSNLVGD